MIKTLYLNLICLKLLMQWVISITMKSTHKEKYIDKRKLLCVKRHMDHKLKEGNWHVDGRLNLEM